MNNKIFFKNEKFLIVNTANRPWSVIDTRELKYIFGHCVISEFFYSASGYKFEKGCESLDFHIDEFYSEISLMSAIENHRPDIIYLRISPHTRSEHLFSVIKNLNIKSKIVVEFYDCSLNFDEKTLNYISGSNELRKFLAINGCQDAFHRADALVFKTGGHGFQIWAEKNITVPYITYFPSVNSQLSIDVSPSKKSLRRVLYAGSVTAREIKEGSSFTHGANVFRYFESILNAKNTHLTIMNAAHWSESENSSPKFANLIDWCSNSNYTGKIKYSMASPREDIVRNSHLFDLGICCAHYADDIVMDVTKFGMPNRATTYIQAGLPVVIDDRFEYMSNLISEYSAGIVVPAGNFDYFVDSILNIDLRSAKLGLLELNLFMTEENKKSNYILKNIG